MKFVSLPSKDKAKIRRAYLKLNNLYLSEDAAEKLTPNEVAALLALGESEQKSEKVKQVIGFLIAVVLVGGFIAYNFVQAKKLSNHYKSVANVDVCRHALKSLNLFSNEIDLLGFLPNNPETEHKDNTSSCNFFMKGGDNENLYEAFVTAEVKKTTEKKADNSREAKAELVAEEPYDVYGWDAEKDFYKISVSAGIDPSKSDIDPELSDIVIRLITLLVGTGISDGIENSASDAEL